MFFKRIKEAVKEAGKAISTSNMAKIQDIHDSASSLGAGCSYGGMTLGGGVYEADRDPARITEAALPHTESNDSLRGHLRSALNAKYGTDNSRWDNPQPYIQDVFPSHVVYQHEGQTRKRPYKAEFSGKGQDPKVTLGEAKQVHVAYVDSTEAAKESIRILTDIPTGLKERNIPDAERQAAPEEDFAGKGRSFPILAAEDVKAALESIGRAGYDNYGSAELKKRILAIAKRKGFATPKADSKESVIITSDDGVVMVREGVSVMEVHVKEGHALPKPIPVKLIGPGWGSMAYYSKEVLQRDGPGVFKKGTHMMWNHATDSQESERPEGDLNSLAAVLTKDAEWQDAGPKGPGLYSEAKVFSDFAEQISEKGAHIGVSINAGIHCSEGEMEGRSGRIAEKFVHAFSTDFVTKAGAGGAPIVPVLESARGASPQSEKEVTMEVKEAEALRTENEGLKVKLAAIELKENQTVAVATIGTVLKEAGIEYSEPILRLVCAEPKMKEGKVDPDWAKGILAHFTEGKVTGQVKNGDGGAAPVESKPEDSLKESLKELGVPAAGLEFAVAGRA